MPMVLMAMMRMMMIMTTITTRRRSTLFKVVSYLCFTLCQAIRFPKDDEEN